MRCRMGIFSLGEIIQQAGALEKRYGGAIAWRMIYLLKTMPDVVSESVQLEWRGAPWRSVGGSGTPLGEMNHASTIQYQRVLRERLERDGGLDLVMDAEARRRKDFPEMLPDSENIKPSFDTPPPQERYEPKSAVAQVLSLLETETLTNQDTGNSGKRPPLQSQIFVVQCIFGLLRCRVLVFVLVQGRACKHSIAFVRVCVGGVAVQFAVRVAMWWKLRFEIWWVSWSSMSGFGVP